MSKIGNMPMPRDFRYRDVFYRGKPQHDRADAFRCRHPRMDIGKRAKIFAPFDALKGFREAIEKAQLIAQGEYSAYKTYASIVTRFPDVKSVREDEKRHGDIVNGLLAEEP